MNGRGKDDETARSVSIASGAAVRYEKDVPPPQGAVQGTESSLESLPLGVVASADQSSRDYPTFSLS
jgi:hypothetical protein